VPRRHVDPFEEGYVGWIPSTPGWADGGDLAAVAAGSHVVVSVNDCAVIDVFDIPSESPPPNPRRSSPLSGEDEIFDVPGEAAVRVPGAAERPVRAPSREPFGDDLP
jgi:hypothetical protein